MFSIRLRYLAKKGVYTNRGFLRAGLSVKGSKLAFLSLRSHVAWRLSPGLQHQTYLNLHIKIIDKFHDKTYTWEYKYDGERAQIHYMEDGKVEIYSRNAERNTDKFPDVVLAASRFKKPSISSFVMDCEVVANWQLTGKRRRFFRFSCEGLIIKTLDKEATYEPSKRSNNWLKLKKDYMDGIGDSLDLVPIGAFHGRGKRTGVYGAFLLACYDSNNEEFQSICKIGTGFSEAVLEERSSSLRSKVISNPKSYYRYGETLEPDVWFEPSEVWEVKAADLTISPVHRAAVGIVDADKGISLRFPRLIRNREDKTPEQASSSEQVAELFTAQKNNHRNNKDDAEDE